MCKMFWKTILLLCLVSFGTCGKVPSKVDGGWSKWSDWKCSVTCGSGGVYSRFRTCTNPVPSNGGKFCTGDSSQTDKCPYLPDCPKKYDDYSVNEDYGHTTDDYYEETPGYPTHPTYQATTAKPSYASKNPYFPTYTPSTVYVKPYSPTTVYVPLYSPTKPSYVPTKPPYSPATTVKYVDTTNKYPTTRSTYVPPPTSTAYVPPPTTYPPEQHPYPADYGYTTSLTNLDDLVSLMALSGSLMSALVSDMFYEATAVAVITGAGEISGVVRFTPNPAEGTLTIAGEISGLKQCRYAIGIHRYGDTTEDCKNVGGGYDPYRYVARGRNDTKKFYGDIGYVDVGESGSAKFIFYDILIRLNKFIGRSIVFTQVHCYRHGDGYDGDDKSYDQSYDESYAKESHDKPYVQGYDEAYDKESYVQGYDNAYGTGYGKPHGEGSNKAYEQSHDKDYDNGYETVYDDDYDTSHKADGYDEAYAPYDESYHGKKKKKEPGVVDACGAIGYAPPFPAPVPI